MGRIRFAFILIVLLFAFTTLRLFYWQIVRGAELQLEASAQYNLTFALPAARGSIRSSDGSPLTMNVPASLVFAKPTEIEDPSDFAKQVSAILSLEEKNILTQITQEGRVWVPLARKISTETTNVLRALNLAGLGFEPVSKRFYPEASMAAQLLGFVGLYQNGNDKGYFGLEGYYDRELRGKDGRREVEKDVRGAPILVGEEKRVPASDGRSLELWVDRTTFHPRRWSLTTAIVPPDSVLKFKDKQVTTTLSGTLDAINEPVSIQAPTPFISLDEAMLLVTGAPLPSANQNEGESFFPVHGTQDISWPDIWQELQNSAQ